MSTAALAVRSPSEEGVLESVICEGNLARLQPADRVKWYKMRCESVGLDPRTQPFQYIVLNGKLTLYATKTATEQLCEKRHITTEIRGRERMDDLYIVTCRAQTHDGRFTDSIGAASINGLKAEALANALMKAETKAKRRAVLSLCGLGMLDENEVADIPGRAAMSPIFTPDELQIDGEAIEAHTEAQRPQDEVLSAEPIVSESASVADTMSNIEPAEEVAAEPSDPSRVQLLEQVTRLCIGLGYDLAKQLAARAKAATKTNDEIVKKVIPSLEKLLAVRRAEESRLRTTIYGEFARLGWGDEDIAEYMRKNEQYHGGTVLEEMSLAQLRNVAEGMEIK
jgi:hypothetical protein